MKPHQVLLAILTWAFVFMIAVTANRPPHGGWGMNMQSWSMQSGEAPPGWFPIPLFHADPAGRQGEPPSPPDPEDLAIGVTTYAEYMNGATTLRMRGASGQIVSVDRSTVSVMPFTIESDESLYYRIGKRPSEPYETDERFPVFTEGDIYRSPSDTDAPDRVTIWSRTWNDDRSLVDTDIFVLPDGTIQPERARISFRGFAPRHMLLLGMCAGYATLAAGAVLLLARLLSAKRPPEAAA